MYQYSEFDRNFVNQRVAHYRDQTQRYLDGKLSDDEFLQLRLRNGLYIQRLAPMLRVAVPYGTLSSKQLRALATIARDYDRGYGHLSTRQNMQFNWPALEDVPDILQALADVDMHAIQTSGSCIRNVTTDQFAGAAADEHIDPRPFCELLRQWSTSHPEFEWLTRKFKIAVTGASQDRAAIGVHDIGMQIYGADTNLENALVDIYAGGGLGRTPVLGALIYKGLPVKHLLTYTEAIMRVYNRYGRRDNKYKARIKILVRALTAEGFKAKVDEEWEHLKDGVSTVPGRTFERLSEFFTPPAYTDQPDVSADLADLRLTHPAFNRWLTHNVGAHKRDGYAVVTLSTKSVGVPPGDVSSEQIDAVADWADKYSFGEIRISHEQNFVLAHVAKAQLFDLWQQAESLALASHNNGLLSDIICCPGGDYCSLANAKSLPVAEAIQRRFDDYDFQFDLGDIDLNISGCMNACGHHHVGHIGILGVDKKGQEFYQISLGGHAGHSEIPPKLGQIVGPSVARAEVCDVIDKILRVYLDLRLDHESFLSCFNRVGIDTFKENIYASAA
ncbi:MAG: nitrite/sulfite reductase [Gammaproteobacteria bacterium]